MHQIDINTNKFRNKKNYLIRKETRIKKMVKKRDKNSQNQDKNKIEHKKHSPETMPDSITTKGFTRLKSSYIFTTRSTFLIIYTI